MRKRIQYQKGRETVWREHNYIPVRYILAVIISLLEVGAVIGSVVLLSWLLPYFYIVCQGMQIVCAVKIISSDDNPDYKVPWLLFVMILPIAGFMLYFMLYSRTLQKKFIRRLEQLRTRRYTPDSAPMEHLRQTDPRAAGQAQMLCDMADCALFQSTKQTYYPSGEEMHRALREDLERAEKFIFMEYFIIKEGAFWGSVLEILKKKAAEGVEVRVVWDDIGCMFTLPGNYAKTLGKFNISATPFSRLRGNADSEFNNRSHRKITVIDGRVGYTGGINIADESINEQVRFGHWKDTAIRLEGDAVKELTRLFLIDYGLNVKALPGEKFDYFDTGTSVEDAGYVIPFGDGPNPLYRRRVGKSAICNLLNSATRYVYMTTPYLIIDNDTCQCIENAALRGVDVRIIVPFIPDKVVVYGMTQSYYPRLLRAGVRIYEYEPGFIHAKSYLADDEYGIIGTINLDYRSLVHHFENGVWMYRCGVLADLKADVEDTMKKSVEVTPENRRPSRLVRAFRAVVRIFAPMM